MFTNNKFIPISFSIIFAFLFLETEELFCQTFYTSDDGLITYTVPSGFKLTDLPEQYHSVLDPDYKMAYKESNSGVNPCILLNVDIVSSEALRDASFIYHQRDLLSEIYSNVSIENVINFASDNHPDILNAHFLVETNGVRFYNSIYYFFYNLNQNETIMWTMTGTYSYQERNTYSMMFKNSAKSFVFNQ
jgi:hypothetical protein